LAEQRVGTAFDAHRLVAGRRLVLGGVELPAPSGLEGHSDADIVCHVLCDAVLGATALGDIGRRFPNTEEWRDAASIDLLARVCTLAADEGWRLVNADCVVVLQEPFHIPFYLYVSTSADGGLVKAAYHQPGQTYRLEGTQPRAEVTLGLVLYPVHEGEWADFIRRKGAAT